MSKFDGFSEDEINKISSKPKKERLFADKPLKVGLGIRRVTENTQPSVTATSTSLKINKTMVNQKNSKNSENGVKAITKSSISTIKIKDVDNANFINYDRKLSDESLKKLHEAVHFQPLSKKNEIKKETKNEKETDDSCDESIVHLSPNKNESRSGNINEPKQHYQQMSPFRGISLKDFESQRKIREEQNKIKKEMLYKAIEKHTQKTVAEQKKIEDIKSELTKLDQDLAADVAILRKQIETACINYSNIEKHYNKVEQMFLKAKLDLHQASEKKELLTEHLCTVITHNEDRKAKKLSELMEKVGLTAGDVDELSFNNNIAEVIDK